MTISSVPIASGGIYMVRRKKKGKKLILDLEVKKVRDLTFLNIDKVLKRKRRENSFLAGIGETTLKKFTKRANILVNLKKPVIYQLFDFPKVSYELFFDIEDDPTQELVYLHGIYERSSKGERFVYFLAKENNQEEEKRAWQQFWEYHGLKEGWPKLVLSHLFVFWLI